MGTTEGMRENDHRPVSEAERREGDPGGAAEGPLFSRDFVLATVANFVNAFGIQMLVATLPLYVISLGGSRADAGLVSGLATFTAMLFRPFAGWLSDAWRRRPLVLMGTSCYVLGSTVYLLAGSIPQLLLGRFVHGFGLSCYTTGANAYVADLAPGKRRAEAMGLFSAALALGLIMGPVVGFMIVSSAGFPQLFYCSGGLALGAFLISVFAREKRRDPAARCQPWSLRSGILDVDALPMAWIGLCMGTGAGASVFIPLFAPPRGVANPGIYFTVQAIAVLLSRAFSGRLADRHGRATAIVPGLVLMGLALGPLPLAQGLPAFVVSAALFGIGFGMAQPAAMALLIDRVGPARRGLATSTYLMGFDAGNAAGAVLLGLVSTRWGFGVMWPMAAAFILLGLGGLWLAPGGSPREGKPAGC